MALPMEEKGNKEMEKLPLTIQQKISGIYRNIMKIQQSIHRLFSQNRQFRGIKIRTKILYNKETNR